MHQRILVGLLLAVLGSLACGNVALAEGKPGDERPPPADAPLDGDRPDAPPHSHGPGATPSPGFGPEFGPPQEVMQTASEIERLYREQGKPREAIALYQELRPAGPPFRLRQHCPHRIAAHRCRQGRGHAEAEPG